MKNPSDQLQKHTLNLRAGDFDFLSAFYEPRGIKGSQALRYIISREVDRLRASENQPDLEININV